MARVFHGKDTVPCGERSQGTVPGYISARFDYIWMIDGNLDRRRRRLRDHTRSRLRTGEFGTSSSSSTSPATTAPEENDSASPATGKPSAGKRFSRFKPAMPREEAARQGVIAGAAWSVFQDRDAVMAFLNTHRDDIGGRPLDIAIASDDGLRIVRNVLDTRSI